VLLEKWKNPAGVAVRIKKGAAINTHGLLFLGFVRGSISCGHLSTGGESEAPARRSRG